MADITPIKAIRSGADVVALGEFVATDTIAATQLNITGATEIGAALVDADELPVYDASATANRKSLLSRVWTYIKAKIAGEAVQIGGTTPAAGAFTSLSVTTAADSSLSLFNSSDANYKAIIKAIYANESFVLSGANDYKLISTTGYSAPNTLIFHSSNLERMRIANGGNVLIGTTATDGVSKLQVNGDIAASGIYLGGTVAANKLSDYEEGTFTATLRGSVSDPTTPVTTTGYYTKVGNMVYVSIGFNSVNTTGASGEASISGLPFTAKNISGTICFGVSALTITPFVSSDSGTTQYPYMPSIAANASVIKFGKDGWTSQTCNHNAGASRYIRVNIQYLT